MDRRSHNCSHRLHHLTISFLFLLISSSTQLSFTAEGRTISKPRTLGHSQQGVKEEKVILRGQIGSRPPRCERRYCTSCGRYCEAIQVPASPQITTSGSKNSSSILSRGGDGSSNYKPMSWKCKCGNSIFNP